MDSKKNLEKHWNTIDKVYLDVVDEILNSGSTIIKINDRTGVGTRSIHCVTTHYDLRGEEEFPKSNTAILTCRNIARKILRHELVLFFQGKTDSKILEKQGVNIWKGNTTKEFLTKRGLNDYREGDMGPVYGWNWNHFGAQYKGCDFDYDEPHHVGYNQLFDAIKQLNNRETMMSRRIIISAWDPTKISEAAVPPCHILFQFLVIPDQKDPEKGKPTLDLVMTQRSADVLYGVPYNILMYSVILSIFSRLIGYKVGQLHHTMHDCHLYLNQLDAAEHLLGRKRYSDTIDQPEEVMKQPLVHIDMEHFERNNTIGEFSDAFLFMILKSIEPQHIKFTNYHSHPDIPSELKPPMAV